MIVWSCSPAIRQSWPRAIGCNTAAKISSPRFLTIAGVTTEGEQSQVTVTESLAVTPQTQFTLLKLTHMNVLVAVGLVLAISAGIGLLHGLLITNALSGTVVTLCRLLLPRLCSIDQRAKPGVRERVQRGSNIWRRGGLLSVPIPFELDCGRQLELE